MNVDSRKTKILDDMIALQTVVYFEEVEIVFDKIHKFEIPSFLHLSLKPQSTVVPEYIRIFPAVVDEYESVAHLFEGALVDKFQIEWHELRNHFLQEHRADLELLLQTHPQNNHIFGSIILREREYEPTFVASETP